MLKKEAVKEIQETTEQKVESKIYDLKSICLLNVESKI
jgi:hypothetical protein